MGANDNVTWVNENKLFSSIKDMYAADTPAPDGRRQNQKNLLVLALYCNMRRTLGISYIRKYYMLKCTQNQQYAIPVTIILLRWSPRGQRHHLNSLLVFNWQTRGDGLEGFNFVTLYHWKVSNFVTPLQKDSKTEKVVFFVTFLLFKILDEFFMGIAVF